MGFKARKKLIARKRECFTRVEGVELETVVEWCVSRAKDLRFIGREFHKRERSCGMIDLQTSAWWKQVERKDTDDLRNGFCWEV